MPLMVLAAMVTVIALQALISGAYSLTCQATQLGSCPGLRSITSPRHFGQFYVSSIILMTTWKRGRELLAARMRTNRVPVETFIKSIAKSEPQRVSGTGVYLSADPESIPSTLLTNLRHHEVLHEAVVLVSVDFDERARLPEARRHDVEILGEGFFRVVVHYGFMGVPDVPTALANIVSADCTSRSGAPDRAELVG